MGRLFVLILLTVLASGCNPFSTALGLLKPSEGVSVDAELTVGDKEETVATDVAGEKTVNTADSITYNIQETDKTSFFWVAFAFLGWLLPSPRQCYMMIAKWITFVKRGPNR